MTPSPSRRNRLPKLTDRLTIGTSSLSVSPFCLGMTGTPETVPFAFDAGINFFFVSADMHWPYYEPLRRGLSQLLRRGSGVRDDIVVAVVTYLTRPEQMRIPFEEVLEFLPELERVDVCVAGWTVADDPPARLQRLLRHRESRFAGCRAAGAAYHDRHLAAAALNEDTLDLAFVRYNPSHPGAREDVFPHVQQSSALLYGFKSVSGWVDDETLATIPSLPKGTWQPTVTDHYRFALTPPRMSGVLCAPQTPEHIRALADAMEEGPLSDEEEEHMMDLAALAAGQAEILPEPTGVAR